MSRVLVVFAHPVRDSFVGSMLDSTLQVLTESGTEHRLIDLYAEDFSPALTLDHYRLYEHGTIVPELAHHVDSLRWADALMFVYPTWFGAPPAILKGWFDRVWLRGVAFDLPSGTGLLKPLLRNIRSVIVVTSHGSGKLLNSVQGEPGKRMILRGMRSLCSRRCSTTWIAFYKNDRATEADRKAFLDRLSSRLRTLLA